MISKAANIPVGPRNPVVPLRLKGEFAFVKVTGPSVHETPVHETPGTPIHLRIEAGRMKLA